MEERTDGRKDRGQATRQHVITIAARLFADLGYDQTSIEAVLQESKVSRGALYHHFHNKEVLFTAVLETIEKQIVEKVAAAAREAPNPLDALRVGCATWLELARDPVVRRVALIDAPSVLGWQTWREIDSRYALGLLTAAFGMAAQAGRLRTEMISIYAHMLLAMLGEMALLIARSDDEETTVRDAGEAVEQVLSRLLGVEPNGQW